MMARGSLDIALELLRGHRLPHRWSESDPRVWESVCPSCLEPDYGLRIREPKRGGPVSLLCHAGCTAVQIRSALEREPVEPRVEAALALAEQARDIAARALRIAENTSESSAPEMRPAG
jgi:hypothetical protein